MTLAGDLPAIGDSGIHVDENLSMPVTVTGLLRDLLNVGCSVPRHLMKAAFELALQSTEALKCALPGSEDKLVWQVFQNKLQAFHLYQHVDLILGLSKDRPVSLREMVHKASSLGPFFAPWAREGLGNYYARLSVPADLSSHILDRETMQWLAPEMIVPLHTGTGLALAEMALARHQGSAATAEAFLQLCRHHSFPDLFGATFEALGLVVRNLYPDSMEPLSRYFWSTNQELFEYFWHGVGRGIYFSPINSLPYWSSPWQGYETAVQEAPNDLARRNAVAGFAWAATLVNLRHCEVIASLLERYGERLAANDAFANGVFSAVVIWLACAPGDSYVVNLLQHQPEASLTSVRHLWEQQVRGAAEAALQFSRDGEIGLGALFRYQPVSLLESKLPHAGKGLEQAAQMPAANCKFDS